MALYILLLKSANSSMLRDSPLRLGAILLSFKILFNSSLSKLISLIANVFNRVFLLFAKDALTTLKKVLRSSIFTLGLSRTLSLITVDSTFGWGIKTDRGTL